MKYAISYTYLVTLFKIFYLLGLFQDHLLTILDIDTCLCRLLCINPMRLRGFGSLGCNSAKRLSVFYPRSKKNPKKFGI